MVVAGALLVVWPLQYRYSMAKVRRRVIERGGDIKRLDRAMDRASIRAALVISPILGILVIVVGVTS